MPSEPASTRPGAPVGGATFHGALDVPLDLPLADAGTRAVAQAIDLCLLSLLVFLVAAGGIAAGVGLGVAGDLAADTAVALTLAVVVVLMFLAQWFFFVGCELWMEGQSPGKLVMGLRVVTTDGATVTLVPSLIRNLLRIVDLFPSTYSVGLVVMLFNRKGQRLGDLAAGTVVVREQQVPEGPRPVRLPPGASPEDVALIEDFLRRAPGLAPQKRRALSMGMVQWLEGAAPGFLGPEVPGQLPERRLWSALTESSPPPTLDAPVGADS